MKAELEAAILDNPDDESAYLVLADHLIAEGDPRGELIVLQHDLDVAEGARKTALKKAVKAHLDKYAAYFALPHKQRKAVWRYGFVRSLELDLGNDGTLQALGEILQNPSCQFIVELQIGQLYEDHYDVDVQEVVDVLVEVKKPAPLRTLEITIPSWSTPTTEYGEFGELLATFPYLSRIRLRHRQRRGDKKEDPVHEMFIKRAKKKRAQQARSETDTD